MKKNLFYCALAALVFSSCVKESVTDVVPDGLETITFEASASPESKTTLVDGRKVYWCSGDQISVAGAAAAFANSLAEGETAAKTAFTGEVAAADVYYAAYPYSDDVKWEGAVATLKAPMRQTADAGTFANGQNLAVASTTSQEKAFTFQNVLGYAAVTINAAEVKSVYVTANGGEPLYGQVTVDCSAAVPAIGEAVSNGSHTVTLTADEKFAPGTYYIALLPGTYSEGLTFDFVSADGKIATKSLDGPIELKAGCINTVGTVAELTWTDPAEGASNVIWKGRFVTGSWDNGMTDLAYGRYDWSKAKVGDVLKIYGGATSSKVIPTLGVKNANWSKLAGLNDYYYNPANPFIVTLTEEMITDLTTNSGLVIQGDHYCLTRIELVPEASLNLPVADDKHIVVASEDMVEEAWETQFFIQFEDAFEEGDEWEILMNVKAEKPVTITTQTQKGLGGYLHWQCVGDVAFTTEWTTYSASGIASAEMETGDVIALSLNTLAEANVYYFDNISFKINGVEQIANGTLDSPDELDNFWMQQKDKNNGSIVPASLAGHEPEAGENGFALTMTNETAQENDWNVQVWYTLDEPLKSTSKYELKCDVKSTVARDWCTLTLQSEDGNDSNYNHGISLSTEWMSTTVEITPDKDTYTKMIFNIGNFAGVVSIDNISLKEKGTDVELITNGDFENGSIDGWSSWSNAQGLGEGCPSNK